jgi:hypothetical protein
MRIATLGPTLSAGVGERRGERETGGRGDRTAWGTADGETGIRGGRGRAGRVRQSQITAMARTRERTAKKTVAAEIRLRRGGKGA